MDDPKNEKPRNLSSPELSYSFSEVSRKAMRDVDSQYSGISSRHSALFPPYPIGIKDYFYNIVLFPFLTGNIDGNERCGSRTRNSICYLFNFKPQICKILGGTKINNREEIKYIIYYS
jgi:hypothetical protein